MTPRETEDNAYSNFRVTNKSIMVCYGISGVVNNGGLPAEEGQASDDVQAQGTQLPTTQLEA